MKNTAGNEIPKILPNCDCGLTGGCKKCNPYLSDIDELENWRREFNEDLEKRSKKLKRKIEEKD